MADYRNIVEFQAKLEGTRATIKSLADNGIPDARALIARGLGAHNLQGHDASILPLAVLYSQYNPSLLTDLKNLTSLNNDMGDRSNGEARNNFAWNPIKRDLAAFKAVHGSDIIAQELRSGIPQTVDDVLRTYLSDNYLGGHTTGGAGDTVLKRTLKLLGHIFY
ncbi:hypothetical protein [Neobacillus sp. Marseille-QA0830]